MTAPRFAVIYARVSTEDQGKGFSIPTQIAACQKLAEHEGYSVPDTHLLVDEGISGTTMDRPGLRRLRELVNTKAITAAIVYDPDRLSRNLGHQLLLAEEFEQAGVKLLIVSHPMEHGPEGWLFFQMRGALAEYERAKMLERTRRGLLGRAKAGYVSGGAVPFGYRYVQVEHGGHFELDEEEAAVVRRIFQLSLEGLPTRAIARVLTKERVLTKRDRHPRSPGWKLAGVGQWNPSTIHGILVNEGYTGCVFYNKRTMNGKRQVKRPREEWVAIAIPAIVSADAFQAAQAQLARHKALAQRNRKHEYLFVGGRLRCGLCGRSMTGLAPNGRRVYQCSSRNNFVDPSMRCRGYLDADDAEARVWQAIEQVLQHPELIAAEVRRQQNEAEMQRAEIAKECALIEAALAKCDREERRWAEAYTGEVINLAELKGYRAQIGGRRETLLKQRQALQVSRDQLSQAVDRVEALTEYCVRVRQQLQTFDATDKRRAFEALDVRVTWTRGVPLAIEGNIPFDEIAPISPRPGGCFSPESGSWQDPRVQAETGAARSSSAGEER